MKHLIIFLILTGCASLSISAWVDNTFEKNGITFHRISCNNYSGYEACFEKAGQLCTNGYKLLLKDRRGKYVNGVRYEYPSIFVSCNY